MLDHLRDGQDTLVVWRLDRLGRSLRHLIETIAELEQRGIGFRSLSEGIDTTSPSGRLVFHIFGALAEFERELIRERTRAGLAAARARGRRGGRPAVMTEHKLRVARELLASGEHTMAQIAGTLGWDARRYIGTWRSSARRLIPRRPLRARRGLATA